MSIIVRSISVISLFNRPVNIHSRSVNSRLLTFPFFIISFRRVGFYPKTKIFSYRLWNLNWTKDHDNAKGKTFDNRVDNVELCTKVWRYWH